jgi:hypothetical protein
LLSRLCIVLVFMRILLLFFVKKVQQDNLVFNRPGSRTPHSGSCGVLHGHQHSGNSSRSNLEHSSPTVDFHISASTVRSIYFSFSALQFWEIAIVSVI